MVLLVLLLACGPRVADPVDDSGSSHIGTDGGTGSTDGGSSSNDLSGVALVTDMDASVWFLGDPLTGQVGASFSLAEHHPEECGDRVWCMLYQARHRLAWDGAAEVVYTYSPLDATDGDSLGRDDRIGRVVSVDASTQLQRWRLDALDFSVSFPDGTCPYDPDDPCTPAVDSSDLQAHRCRLYQPHDLHIVEESDEHVVMWIADTRNARMLRVRLPRSETCAVVEEVVTTSHQDWDVYNSVNSFEYRSIDGGEELLMSIKDTFSGAQDGAQYTGQGHGKIVLFRRVGSGSWAQVWEHPPVSTTGESFVNAPHGVAWWEGGEGLTIGYAHSLGAGDAWNEGNGGSVGVLDVFDDVPIYRYDAVIDGQSFGYTRDVHPLPDGRVMVTDTGCKRGQECELPTGVWVGTLPAVSQPAGVSGAWSATGETQFFVDMEASGGRQFTTFEGLYSAEWVGDLP